MARTKPTDIDPAAAASFPAERVRAEFGARCDTGRVRSNNEDHYLIARVGRSLETLSTNLPAGFVPARLEESGFAMVVADGLGGRAAGEVASRLAISLATSLAISRARFHLRLDAEKASDLVERVGEFLREVDRSLGDQAEANPDLRGMATTLTIAYSVGVDLFVFHVGDSRAYLWRDGCLRQVTRDQTMAQMLADLGTIAREDVASHRLRHVLTNVVGGGKVRTAVELVTLADADQLLLCTDGLTTHLSDGEIAEILARGTTPQAACDALVGLTLERGGRDNVTVAIGRYSVPPGTVSALSPL